MKGVSSLNKKYIVMMLTKPPAFVNVDMNFKHEMNSNLQIISSQGVYLLICNKMKIQFKTLFTIFCNVVMYF